MRIELVLIAGVVGLTLLILLLRAGRRLLLALLATGGLGVATVGALALLNQAVAAREAAQAAQIAAAGQTIGSVAVVVLATLLAVVLLGAAVGGGYLYIRLRLAERRAAGRWAPGPNARWQVGAGGGLRANTLDQLLTLELLRALREMRSHPAQPLQLPSGWRDPDDSGVYALLDDGEESWW